jgi:hypothetical protein
MTAPPEERRTASSQVHPPPSPQTTDVIGTLMRGPEGRTARLTVISVLLGAMLAAIVMALPPTPDVFVRTILTPDHLLVDLQVLALLLVVFDVWIQFSWGVILGLVPFDFLGNLLTFVTSVTVIGWALSVADFRAWVAWSAVVTANALLASLRFVRRVRFTWWRLALFATILLAASYVACDAYGVLPAWATVSVPPLLGVAVVVAEWVVDLEFFSLFLLASGARSTRPSR